MSILFLLALALAPGVAIAVFIYLKDKYEKEPILLLFTSFLYGFASVVLVFLITLPINAWIVLRDDMPGQLLATAFLKVALIEEFSKFVFIRFILFNNRNFNEPFDGIVYAVMVGMGFATMENILYVFHYGAETGLIRMFTAVPAHGTFAILMGYYLGKAKFTKVRNFAFSLAALLVPALFHGAYDYFLFDFYVPGIWLGALVSLVVAMVLSSRAIRIHQQASPFINKKSQQ